MTVNQDLLARIAMRILMTVAVIHAKMEVCSIGNLTLMMAMIVIYTDKQLGQNCPVVVIIDERPGCVKYCRCGK